MSPKSKSILCWVTDRAALTVAPAKSREELLLDRIHSASNAGVDWIQLREKDLEGAALATLARRAIASPQGEATKILVNDRVDVAWAAGAQGVHLGENSLPARDVVPLSRQRSAPDFLVGVSCHSLASALQAAEAGASYVLFGPVFATPSKARFGEPQGLPRLEEVCRAVSIPVLALGGITRENFSACRNAGAAGIAAIRLFQEARDLPDLIAQLRM